jgi:hypothetical protein
MFLVTNLDPEGEEMRKMMKQTAVQESYMFLVTNLDPENEYVVFDVRGNTKGFVAQLCWKRE